MSLEKKIINFLKGPKKGETYELKSGLVSQYKFERKDAIQRVIQAMTVGKDVSALFPDVLKNIATYDLEQKKLVYLYLMNYAKLHPELCILAVNTFVQDTEDPNPLVRALAIRTMGCIRVDKMVDYMEIPLRRTLLDDNPYVRKTAAICVAKLFDLNPEMCIEFGFLDEVKKLITDSNPMVVANALNALFEIRDMNRDPSLEVLVVDKEMVKVFLACLNECTEWGRITILTCLADYTAADTDETLHIIERCIPQLQHVNPSVVLLSIKVVIHHLDGLANQAQRTTFLKKLSAPMVSLVSSSIPEAQYVGLKNIRIILEKYPQVLLKELRVFFIKYSDPLYLKLEKLEIVIRLASEANSALLLGELKEYAMEVEPMLVTKSINAIGAVAIKLASSVIHAVNLLISLIDQRGGDLVINECVSVLTQILRRYPGKNDLITLIVPVISNQIDELTETNALSGYVFLLGEYPKYFSLLKDKLQVLVENFLDYDSLLQLNILTAVVKINLALPNAGCSLFLQTVLEKATVECENADVRDKAYIYWRLLSSSSTEAQQSIIASHLPPIKTIISSFNPVLLDALINELATLSSVYHKPASTFIDPDAYSHIEARTSSRRASTKSNLKDLTNLAKQEIINNSRNENLLNFDDDDEQVDLTKSSGSASILDELNDLFSVQPVPIEQSQQGPAVQSSTNDILNLFDSASTLAPNVNQMSSEFSNMNVGQKNKSSQTSTNINDDLLDLF
ncbi:CIC11C00000000313 [Sungouiella intermedia]|uniref:AP complex subunit beta n=1 Tax=Sungouiella intermedia TaxID=45354 RepID=A0A1L0GB34_9ASCO|nr:CIC11C00000000313 [[Candida] intermedia]